MLDRHAGEYGDFPLSKVAKQLHLHKAELLDLFECLMDYDRYVAILRERNEV